MFTMRMYAWNLRCTNNECGAFYEQKRLEPDVLCNRCGSLLEVTEKILIDKEDNDGNSTKGH